MNYDVVDTRTGHVALRNVEHAVALSAAGAFNLNWKPPIFRVFEHPYTPDKATPLDL